MTDGFALKSWVISLFNKASKKNNKYSTTEETVVGTWIDGKPIYRKVYTIDHINKGMTKIEHNLTDFDALVNARVLWYDTEDLKWYTGLREYSSYQLGDEGLAIDSKYIDISTVDSRNGIDWSTRTKSVRVIIEYTKTTDKATITV